VQDLTYVELAAYRDHSHILHILLSWPLGGTNISCIRSDVLQLYVTSSTVNALSVLGTTYQTVLILVLLLALFALLNSLIYPTTYLRCF